MSYRIRFTLPDGRTGLWAHEYQTREAAHAAIDDRLADTCFAYAVEEVQDAPQEPKPEPTITTERLVGLLRDRHARGLAKYGTTLDREDLTPQQWAQHAIEEALDLAGYLMRLKDGFAPEPGSTAAHHVEILRDRVKELEEMVKERGKAVTAAHVANHVMHVRLSRAIELGGAMHRAMTTARSRFYVDWGEIEVAMDEWTAYKESLAASLAKAPSVPVGASEAPREGGDSDRRRLAVLNDWIRGGHRAFGFQNGIVVGLDGLCLRPVVEAPTLAALADKLVAEEAKL